MSRVTLKKGRWEQLLLLHGRPDRVEQESGLALLESRELQGSALNYGS